MTWSYNPATIATTPKDQVRLLVGDVKEKEPQLQDEELAVAMTLAGSNIYAQAAAAARLIAARYAREVDAVQGELRQMFSARMTRYLTMAKLWEAKLDVDPTAAMPSAGGISVADKNSNRDNGDATRPSFWRGFAEQSIDRVLPLPDLDTQPGFANG